MKRTIMVLVAAAVLAATASPAQAITNGEPDGSDHPYVGLMVADDVNGNPLWRCSGTLISPTVFLTAGHCTEAPAARATIWFAEDVDSEPGYPFVGDVDGTTFTHPQYDSAAFFLYDVGIVELDSPVNMSEYGELPSEGLLDGLARKRGRQNTTITAVGYGLQKINPVFVEGARIRLQAELNLVDVNGTAGVPAGTSVMVTGDAKRGGTCFGDSGGPQFLNDTNIVVAVTSFGLNGNCAGVGGGYRIDQADDLAFIGSHLP